MGYIVYRYFSPLSIHKIYASIFSIFNNKLLLFIDFSDFNLFLFSLSLIFLADLTPPSSLDRWMDDGKKEREKK